MIKLKAVDFFCGAGGMSQGLIDAGINVIGALDNDPTCKETYEANHPGSKFLLENVKEYPVKKLSQNIPGLKKKDPNMIFIGCSPCQHWSIIRHTRNTSKSTSNLLIYFLNFVEHYEPGIVIVENVVGINKNRRESGLADLIEWLEDKGYYTSFDNLKCQYYGVPQTRSRFILIASINKKIEIASIKKSHSKKVADALVDKNKQPLSSLKSGEQYALDPLHKTAGLSDNNIQRLRKTKPGEGNHKWRDDPLLGIDAYRGKKGFYLNYGRMAWDKPAPTITTKFPSLGCGQFGHPSEDRAISLREGALLQTFHHDYKFIAGSTAKIARLIGNAVPPAFAKRIGEAIIHSIQS